jgi:uncharacterized membrane protein YciS (DUF1049 family)
MSKLRTVFFLVAVAVAVLIASAFAWLNPQSVTIDIGIAVVETHIAYAFIVTFALGWAFGLVATAGWLLKLAGQNRRQKRAARLAEIELENLRKIPVADDG